MIENWQDVIEAWDLASAGRFDEALVRAGDHPGLAALLKVRANKPGEDAYPVLAGWRAYYRGEYRPALREFLEQLPAGFKHGWLSTWAELGVAKVASDCGRWRSALEWCARAWRSASDGEHMDLLAQVAGARGEVLLRAGRGLEAAAAFDEDISLLPVGSRYRGRVRCYQAHAWSRLGPHGAQAAQLAYRLAIHSPGESATASFARAGLAILASRISSPHILAEASAHRLDGINGFWAAVAAAKLAVDSDARGVQLLAASTAVPEYYLAERWWFAGWSGSLGISLIEPPGLETLFNLDFPPASSIGQTRVEFPVPSCEIDDAPWWNASSIPRDTDRWWQMRDAFMP